MRLRALEEFLRRHEDRGRRQDRPLGVVLQEAVTFARVGPEGFQRFIDLAVQHQCRLFAEVVEDGSWCVEKQRQVVLDAATSHAVVDVLVDAATRGVAFHLLAPARPESLACRGVHREFAAWQQAHFGHRVQAALAVWVKGADAVHLITKQVHAVGHQRTHGEQVYQAAAHRIFARAHDLAHVLVASQRQLTFQLGFVELAFLLELKRGAGQE